MRKSKIFGSHLYTVYSLLSSKLKTVQKKKKHIKRLQSMRKISGAEIIKDLKGLGLMNGDVLYVHSSLKSIGFVQGGANTVLNALIKAVGPKGTLILPSFSFSGSMVETVTSHRMFDPQTIPCTIGLIPETFRRRQGVFRSIHPSHSVCAYGSKAEWITNGHHKCPTSFGKGTPYWKMKQLNGKILCLGVDIRFISFYHTLEDITPNFPIDVYHDKEYNIPILDENGNTAIMKIKPHGSRPHIIVDNTPQGELLRRYVTDYFVNRNVLHFGKVGEADCWVISIRDFLKCLKELMQKGITIYSTKETLFFGLKLDKWMKHPNNPVLPKRHGKWDSYAIRDFALLISEDNQVVKDSDGKIPAYYCGKATSDGAMKIGFAKSLDNGYISDRLDHPIIEPSHKFDSWYKTQVAQPSVIKRNDGLLMMMAQGWNGNLISLGVFTSNGKAWLDRGRKLTLNQFQDENDNTIVEIGVPCVIKHPNGDFLLVFEGRYRIDGWRIYAATSPSFIGPWKPYNNGYPILTPYGSGWEAIGVANPKLLEIEDSKFLMAYNGIGADLKWRIGFAFSTDLLNWSRYLGNPVISPKGIGWERLHTETSFLEKRKNNRLRLYYQGFASVNVSQVGIAISGARIFAVNPLKLRILHVWDQAGVAGVIAKYQRSLGHESYVLTNKSFDGIGINLFYNSIRLEFRLRRFSKFPKFLGRLFRKIHRLYQSTQFYIIASQYARSFDIVHIHSASFTTFFIPFKPKILEFHGDDIRLSPSLKHFRFKKFINRIIAFFLKHIYVSTKDLTKEIAKSNWLANPVDTEHFILSNPKKPNGKALYIHNWYENQARAKWLAKAHDWKLTILDRANQLYIRYNDMPFYLSQFEYFIDRHAIHSLSKTALEALAMGLKVVRWDGVIVEGLPERHRPENVAKTTLEIYRNVLK